MEIKSTKQMNTYLIIILVFITLTIVFYAYYREHYKIVAGNLEVNFEKSDIIEINNKLPLSDTLGKSYNGTGMEEGIAGYSSFSITNPNDFRVKYEIYITRQNVSSKDISGKYVVFYLTDEDDKPLVGFSKNKLPVYNDFKGLDDKPISRLIYSGKLDALSTQNVKLRTWVSDAYALINEEEAFSFDIDVRIK